MSKEDDFCNEHGCMVICVDSESGYCIECLVSELKEHLESFSKETIARWIVSNANYIDVYDTDFGGLPKTT